MRIRKEISKWSIKTFLKLAGLLLVIFNLFTLLAAYIDHSVWDVSLNFTMIAGIFYPLLLASILTTGFRTGTLYINDYQSMVDFKEKLKSKIEKENMVIESEINNHAVYRPRGGYYSLFNAWRGTEKLTATWGDEIVLSGSLRKVTALEDVLTWNKEFRTLRPESSEVEKLQ
ncbi:MAG TPA: hypothetical protein PLV21_09740 [Cyclobacteriaceae bacterium]|nr:hypothetical protein [Cyclobacteriaceae bacterium]HRJ82154.1 hypothetical protein [Cyclobacteriaceae bacterium]